MNQQLSPSTRYYIQKGILNIPNTICRYILDMIYLPCSWLLLSPDNYRQREQKNIHFLLKIYLLFIDFIFFLTVSIIIQFQLPCLDNIYILLIGPRIWSFLCFYVVDNLFCTCKYSHLTNLRHRHTVSLFLFSSSLWCPACFPVLNIIFFVIFNWNWWSIVIESHLIK